VTNGVSSTFATGSSTFAPNIALSATETVDVATGGTLELSGVLSGSGFGVTKTSGGTLDLTGNSANTYSGTLTVSSGLLELGKSSKANAFAGDLVIGDNSGSDDSVTLLASGQIPNAGAVTVNEGATFDVGGFVDAIGALTLQGASVTIGSGGELTLTSLATNVTSNNVTSHISGAGLLDLGGNPTFSMNIADDTDIADDARISAPIQDGGIIKAGAGTLALSGSNTFGGDTSVTTGAIQVESDAALGAASADVTNVYSGASVYFSGMNLNVAEDFSIGGVGVASSCALTVASGSTTLTGTVVLLGDSQLGAADGSTLTINGVISESGGARQLNIIQGINTGITVLGGSNTYSGGTTVVYGTLAITNASALGTGPVTVGDGTGTAGHLELDLTGTNIVSNTFTFYTPITTGLQVNSGTTTFNGGTTLDKDLGIDVATGASLQFAGPIGDGGQTKSLTKDGTGTLIFYGINTYTGATLITDGTVVVDGDISSSSGVSIGAGGILTGDGAVGTITSTGGTVAPGDSPGILSSADVTLDGSSTFSTILSGTTTGSGYSQLVSSGPIDLGGATLKVSLRSNTPTPADVLTIIDNTGSSAITNTFSGLAEGDTLTVSGYSFGISYIGGSGNDVTLTNLATTTTQISSSSSSTSTYGQLVLFTVLVAPTVPASGKPAGSVEFYDGDPNSGGLDLGGGTLNGIGIATLSTSVLTASRSPHDIFGVFVPSDENFNASTTAFSFTQTVNLATLTVTADNQSRTYGDANPTLTATYSGFQNGEDLATSDVTGSPALSTLATASSPVSSSPYEINAVAGTLASSNYSITYENGSLTVNQTPLSITANDQSKVFGAALPPLTFSARGFVNGDTVASLTVPPTLSTSATATSPVSSYPIFATGATATNYAIAYHAGTLAVGKSSTTTGFVTSSGTSVYGQATTFTVQVNPVGPGAGVLTGIVTFVVDGNSFASAPVDPSTGQAMLTTASLGMRTHTVTSAYLGNSNFFASQLSSIQQVVNQGNTQPLLMAQAVRNRRGRITSVILTSQIGVTTPGSGVPTGGITYFMNRRFLTTRTLSGATYSLTVSPKRALGKTFYVRYSGDGDYSGGRSAKLFVNRTTLTDSAPAIPAYISRGQLGHPFAVTPKMSVLAQMAGFSDRFGGKGH
jgi:fibronectin-binding autotransporter adhesin